jgi:hypothetical protein
MQAAVERVFRSFTLKQPALREAAHAQDDSSEFAVQLLNNYRTQLAQRAGQSPGQRQD